MKIIRISKRTKVAGYKIIYTYPNMPDNKKFERDVPFAKNEYQAIQTIENKGDLNISPQDYVLDYMPDATREEKIKILHSGPVKPIILEIIDTTPPEEIAPSVIPLSKKRAPRAPSITKDKADKPSRFKDMPSKKSTYKDVTDKGYLAWQLDVPRGERMWKKGTDPYLDDYIDLIADRYNLSDKEKADYYAKWKPLEYERKKRNVLRR